MKKPMILILLIIVVGLAGYFIGSTDFNIFNDITGNVVINNQEIIIPEEDNESTNLDNDISHVEIPKEQLVESPKVYNNPPVNKEDYLNLLGTIDYNKSYELFFSIDENDSAINYSKDPIEEVVDFLDKFIFWSDEAHYKVEDYWAIPNESLSRMRGDDEDYVLLALALSNNFHDKNQSCYLIGNEEFTGLLCYTSNYEKYYGEMVIKSYTLDAIYSDNWWQSAGDVWTSKIVLEVDDGYTENLVRAELRNFIKTFMIDSVGYCCTDYYKNDVGLDYENRAKLKFLYNEKEFYELETTKDLEDWMYGEIKDKIFGQALVR